MSEVALLGLGTALPEQLLRTSEARDFARLLFARDFDEDDPLFDVFEHTQIDRRALAMPTSWYGRPHEFPEKNAVYVKSALELSERAALQALERARVEPEQIGAIVFVSSTGIAAPSLDATLIGRLGLDPRVLRLPLWGLGCAGGAAGVGRGMDLARATGRPTLVIAAEICSVTFVHEDRRKANVIAVALFGDGAAAAVVGEGEGPRLLASTSHLLPNSEQVMGWDLCPTGLKVRFSPEIPEIVRAHAVALVDEAAAAAGSRRGDFRHWALHPGGAKVLDAYAQALELDESALASARAVLREHGNMSSPTLLFVLDHLLRRTPATGELGLAMGLGPGFCGEGVVFRW